MHVSRRGGQIEGVSWLPPDAGEMTGLQSIRGTYNLVIMWIAKVHSLSKSGLVAEIIPVAIILSVVLLVPTLVAILSSGSEILPTTDVEVTICGYKSTCRCIQR